MQTAVGIGHNWQGSIHAGRGYDALIHPVRSTISSVTNCTEGLTDKYDDMKNLPNACDGHSQATYIVSINLYK